MLWTPPLGVSAGREGSSTLAAGGSYTVDFASRSVGSRYVISPRIVDTDGLLTDWASSTQVLDNKGALEAQPV